MRAQGAFSRIHSQAALSRGATGRERADKDRPELIESPTLHQSR